MGAVAVLAANAPPAEIVHTDHAGFEALQEGL